MGVVEYVTYALLTALYLNSILLGSSGFKILQTDLEGLYNNPGFAGQTVLPATLGPRLCCLVLRVGVALTSLSPLPASTIRQ